MTKFFSFKNLIIFLFIFYYLIGLATFTDYGISVDELFERRSGLYWLNEIFNYFEINKFNNLIKEKIELFNDYTLPEPQFNKFYGVIFSVPAAFLEIIFSINDSQKIFFFYHFLNFNIFFFSSYFFYRLLKNRFSNLSLSLIGTLFYVLSPRIYAHSYFNNKDIIFLSLVTISLYYCFIFFKKQKLKHLFIFAFFSALCTSSRILGFFFPLLFLVFNMLPSSKNRISLRLNFILKYLFTFIIILYLFWPALWSGPISETIEAFKYFKNLNNFEIYSLFNGNYISNKNNPFSYLICWIFISTPTLYLILFLLGYFYTIRRFYLRLIKLKNHSYYDDFWRSKNEKADLFVLIAFTIFFVFINIFNLKLYTGWRQLYFLNTFIIYLSVLGVYYIYILIKSKIAIRLFLFSILIYLSLLVAKMAQLHPFQNIYFNTVSLKFNVQNNFEIDYWGLSGRDFLNKIVKNDSRKIINIGVASWIPLERSKWLLNKKERERLNFVGENYSLADYIYDSGIYNKESKKIEKYKIPSSFQKFNTFKIKEILIYTSYKKIN